MTKKLVIFFLLIVAIITAVTCTKNEENIKVSDLHPSEKECPEWNTKDSSQLIFPDPSKNNCVSCHSGIEPIRDPSSGMMQEIYKMADKMGFADNECVVCHGGNPTATNKKAAHSSSPIKLKEAGGADAFYPDPASVWINDKTCGLCHQEQVSTQFTSLMFTEAGKIQGTTWGFGGIQGYLHNVANIATEELKVHERLGSAVYKEYMAKLKEEEPQVFPGKMKGLPKAPTPAEASANPQQAVYTYLRSECQRCHIGVKGHNADGDYRGTGCGSCHIPYSNKGLYEGNDPTIDKKESGNLLVHSMQSTRDAPVMVHGKSYSGVPTKTCTACHNRGRRIGVSYEGLMETSYKSAFMGDGGDQKQIHKKNYIHLQPDLHLSKGMVCQDCHTSGDMHSLGDLSGAIQGAVEIECEDCHGTPFAYPWELPIGYGDEIAGEAPQKGKPRGLSKSVMQHLYYGWVAPPKDGYLISSRGNAMPHIVKNGDEIILYSAGGKDIALQPLKKLKAENKLSLKAKVAMCQVQSHIDKMECYACHATWAPQCYGCHIKIDYSKTVKKTDWVAMAKSAAKNGLTADAMAHSSTISDAELSQLKKYVLSGEVEEQRSYLRWEDPPLVINGDHRVSPAIPGCQTTVTVIGEDGSTKMLNHIFRIPNVEGAGPEGQLGIDIAPVQPHTTQKEARSCESCHNNPKSMGYGIEDGKLYADPSENYVMDLTDVDGNVLPNQVDTQFNAIRNLHMDWSKYLDSNGKQLQTVGHHFTGSRPLGLVELQKLDRRGVCMSCHQSIPDQDLAIDLLSHVAKYSDVTIDNEEHDSLLNKSVKTTAWVEILLLFFVLMIVVLVVLFLWKRKQFIR